MAFSNQSTKLRLLKLLQDSWSSQPNSTVSLSKLSQTLNVSRERVRQLYRQLEVEYALPPIRKRSPGSSVINRHQTNDAATKLNRSKVMVRKPKGRALEDKVRAFSEQGMTVAEIVKRTGRHESTIQRIRRRLHISAPPKRKSPQTLALEAEVRKYSEQGLSAPEMARKIGRNRKTIYTVLSRLGLPFSFRPKGRALEDKVRAFSEQGMTVAEIVKRTGRHESTIYSVRRRLGLPFKRMKDTV